MVGNPITSRGGIQPAVSSGPPITAGLVAQWEADSLALNDGDAVSTWTDQSGNGRDATGSGTTRPLYKANIFGTKPAVRFDGSDDELAFTPSSLTAWTVFLVWKVTTRQQYSGPISWRGASKAGFVVWDSADSTGYDMTLTMTDTSNAEIYGKYSATRHGMPSAACLDVLRSAGGAGSSPDRKFYGANPSEGGFGGLNAYGAIQTIATLGRAGFAGFDNCGCDLGAVLVYDTSFSDADRTTVVNWLNAKYGVF